MDNLQLIKVMAGETGKAIETLFDKYRRASDSKERQRLERLINFSLGDLQEQYLPTSEVFKFYSSCAQACLNENLVTHPPAPITFPFLRVGDIVNECDSWTSNGCATLRYS